MIVLSFNQGGRDFRLVVDDTTTMIVEVATFDRAGQTSWRPADGHKQSDVAHLLAAALRKVYPGTSQVDLGSLK